ncbi:MAG: FHA domain-containing protein [Pirellulaceae bacterium]|jgi:pSer/pThr/pTyr-binding forkhead associated (FHA) protein|nr:FHA domain-containing protein [Pirellulaceae bacterium]
MYGELVPVGGGDPIPLHKKRLRIGRREGCDIVLNLANVSGHHCLMEIEEGYWFIRDLKSKNGIKLNNKKILPGVRRRVDPGSIISIAKNNFEVQYEPAALGAYGSPPQDELLDNLFGTSLLDRAGLSRRKAAEEGDAGD